MILRDWKCHDCEWIFESLEDRGAVLIRCPDCGGDAIPQISGTHAGTVWGAAASQGASQERPSWAMDTRKLAEGQTWRQWKRERQKQRAEERRKEFGITPRIFSHGK